MKPIIAILALGVAILPITAEASTLPKHSLLCGTKPDIDEALRTIGNGDTEWLKSIPSCVVTNQDIRVGIISYDGHAAQIRVFVGGESEVAYTYDRFIQ